MFLATIRGLKIDNPPPLIGDRKAKTLFMWSMSRSGIREIAKALIDSADQTYLSKIVEKVYGDLLALSIPLTPSNVVMYLKILEKENDFHPFNRVDIVEKYLSGALSTSSEKFAETFNSREKIDILSEFAYVLFSKSAGHFVDQDWSEFCNRYMVETLSSFSERDLLRGLEEARVLIRYEEKLYFKYSFFLSFLVGRYVVNHPELITSFLDRSAGYSLYGVVETIAGLTGDGTSIIDRLTSDLELRQAEFAKRYVPLDFDPMSKAEWAINDNDEAMWQAISREVEAGPVPTSELDLIRTSFRAEALTVDQEVRYSKLKQLEFEVFYAAAVLGQALKAAHGVRASVKKRAVVAFLRTEHIVMQIGTILASEIAKREWFQWGGALFIGFKHNPKDGEDEQLATMAIFTAIPGAVSAKTSDDFGSKKLGEAFKTTIAEQPPESFLSLLLFGCLIRTKPSGWEETAHDRIRAIDRKAFYLSEMLDILMTNFKSGVNTLQEREVLKRLIATVHAKRSYSKAAPGARLVRSMVHELERRGVLNINRND